MSRSLAEILAALPPLETPLLEYLNLREEAAENDRQMHVVTDGIVGFLQRQQAAESTDEDPPDWARPSQVRTGTDQELTEADIAEIYHRLRERGPAYAEGEPLRGDFEPPADAVDTGDDPAFRPWRDYYANTPEARVRRHQANLTDEEREAHAFTLWLLDDEEQEWGVCTMCGRKVPKEGDYAPRYCDPCAKSLVEVSEPSEHAPDELPGTAREILDDRAQRIRAADRVHELFAIRRHERHGRHPTVEPTADNGLPFHLLLQSDFREGLREFVTPYGRFHYIQETDRVIFHNPPNGGATLITWAEFMDVNSLSRAEVDAVRFQVRDGDETDELPF